MTADNPSHWNSNADSNIIRRRSPQFHATPCWPSMALNLLWSDPIGGRWRAPSNSYLIVDSAQTHSALPDHDQSLLGQAQRLVDEKLTVEEGVQKILPLRHDLAIALAGDRDRSREFALRLRTALQYSSFASIQAYIREFSKEAGIEVSLAGAGASPPFNTLVIPRQIFVPVEHGQLHITGSLTRAIKSQLADGIKKFCFGLPAAIHPEIRLVIGLACATTMAMHHHLAKDRVGGGVFRSAPG